jgi:hypothetical protein
MISVLFLRICKSGIATFTNDLATSLTRVMDVNLFDGNAVQVTAVNNVQGAINTARVKFEIKEQNIDNTKKPPII